MKKIITVFYLLLQWHGLLHAQTKQSDKRVYMFSPKQLSAGHMVYFTGMSLAQLPTKIVEDVFDQVPMIELKMRYGLPINFSVSCDMNTNIFTNLLKAGTVYSVSIDKLSLSAGADCLFWYGFLKTDGFDVSVMGWGYSPNLSVGYDFDDFVLSLKSEVNIKAQNTYMKSFDYTKNSPKFVGLAFSCMVEQPLWKEHLFALGFRLNYTKFFYKSWISFSAFDEYLFYPEFTAGFVF